MYGIDLLGGRLFTMLKFDIKHVSFYFVYGKRCIDRKSMLKLYSEMGLERGCYKITHLLNFKITLSIRVIA